MFISWTIHSLNLPYVIFPESSPKYTPARSRVYLTRWITHSRFVRPSCLKLKLLLKLEKPSFNHNNNQFVLEASKKIFSIQTCTDYPVLHPILVRFASFPWLKTTEYISTASLLSCMRRNRHQTVTRQ